MSDCKNVFQKVPECEIVNNEFQEKALTVLREFDGQKNEHLIFKQDIVAVP